MDQIIQTKEIAEGIFLIKRQSKWKQDQYIFQVEVKRLNIVEFQCDFTGSENINLKETTGGSLKCMKIIQAYQKQVVATLQLSPEWKLKSKFRFSLKSPPKQKQLQWIQAENKILNAYILNAQTLFKNIDINLTSIQEINNLLQKSKNTFLDLEFIPQQKNILGNQDRSLLDDTVTQWRRPDKFLKPNYQIIQRIHPSRILSGKLANQSFTSVLKCLTLRPPLIERLFYNKNQVNHLGAYRLRLCKNGMWQNVTIDDFIPCQPTSHPKFVRSTDNELWPVLIQKAYAKLHKNYFALRQLDISDVFLDLTGCPTEIYNLAEQNLIKNKLNQYEQKTQIISFYNNEETSQFQQDQFAPVSKRAYPITKIKTKSDEIYLYTEQGEKHFEFLQIKSKFKYMCISEVKNWQQIRIKGKFIQVENSSSEDDFNIISRWYYTFSIQASSQINITLHQEDIFIGCNKQYKPYMWVSLILYQRTNQSRLKPIFLHQFSNKREFNIRLKLDVGNYIIIPITISNLEPTNKMEQSQLVQDIFSKLDLLMNKQLKYAELIPFFKAVKHPYNQQQFLLILKKYTKNKASKGLGFSGFKKLWADYRERWLEQIQEFSLSRQFILSIHSTRQISVLVKDNIGTDLNNRAHVQIITNFGQSKDYDKVAKIYSLKNPNNSISYVIQNEIISKIQVQLNLSQSTGYIFRPPAGKSIRKLDSGQSQYVMQLTPQLRGDLNFNVRQGISVKILQ